MGSSPGCRWRSAPPWTSVGCRGTACLTMVFPRGCSGISAPAARAPPPLSSSLTWGSAGVFHVFSLFQLLFHSHFFPLLKSVIPEALPLSLVGSALPSSGSVLEPAGIGSVGHRGSFQQLLTEATPVTLMLPKPCHTNPIQHLINTETLNTLLRNHPTTLKFIILALLLDFT